MDRKFLNEAISEAEKALRSGNYPFGAVLVDAKGVIVASGHNENFSGNDISAHAEIQCLRKMDIRTLLDPDIELRLYVSGEPCGGCSFFIAKSKSIRHVTWALTDPQHIGFDDLRRVDGDMFVHIAVRSEPDGESKRASSSLLQQYYLQTGDRKKADLYTA